MKRIKLFAYLAVIAAALTFVGCTNCENELTCVNGGEWNKTDCSCDCPAGYGGDDCSTITSCDAGGGVDCGVNATCDLENGVAVCFCDTGYEPASANASGCAVESRAKLLGSYTLIDDGCVPDTESYTSTLSSSASAVQTFVIQNFVGFDQNELIKADMIDTIHFVIPMQNGLEGRKYQGFAATGESWHGTYDKTNARINFNYTVTYADNTSESCNSIMQKN